MGAVKSLYVEREHQAQALRSLRELQRKLAEADALGDVIRGRALRDHSSDEPYENAVALSSKILRAIDIVEDMIRDAEGNS